MEMMQMYDFILFSGTTPVAADTNKRQRFVVQPTQWAMLPTLVMFLYFCAQLYVHVAPNFDHQTL